MRFKLGQRVIFWPYRYQLYLRGKTGVITQRIKSAPKEWGYVVKPDKSIPVIDQTGPKPRKSYYSGTVIVRDDELIIGKLPATIHPKRLTWVLEQTSFRPVTKVKLLRGEVVADKAQVRIREDWAQITLDDGLILAIFTFADSTNASSFRLYGFTREDYIREYKPRLPQVRLAELAPWKSGKEALRVISEWLPDSDSALPPLFKSDYS